MQKSFQKSGREYWGKETTCMTQMKRKTYFFSILKTDKERWDYIEKYFAGIQEEFDENLENLL